jgi:hypothetical protein
LCDSAKFTLARLAGCARMRESQCDRKARLKHMGTSLTVLNNSAPDTDIALFNVEDLERVANELSDATWKVLDKATGGLSDPSKMPCYSYSISAKRCKVGSALRKVKGSTCASCYALKGRYVFPNVEAAMERRYMAMRSDSLLWAAGMVASIRKAGMPYFRWHDSGDLQGMNHLAAIDAIASLTPHVSHWLPTREYALVRAWHRNAYTFAQNLLVRVSLPMVGRLDGADEWESLSMRYSTVGIMPGDGIMCPSSQQGNKCLDCRACWSRNVKCVSYTKH